MSAASFDLRGSIAALTPAPFDASDLNEAARVVALRQADVAAAQELDVPAGLAALVRERAVDAERLMANHEAALAELTECIPTYRRAAQALAEAQARWDAGAVDRAMALSIRDDLEAAASAERALRLEIGPLRAAVLAPLQRLVTMGRQENDPRSVAFRSSKQIAGALLDVHHGGAGTLAQEHGAKASAEIAIWWLLADAAAIAWFEQHSKTSELKRKWSQERKRLPTLEDDLQKCFRARDAAMAATRSKLEAQLAALGGVAS